MSLVFTDESSLLNFGNLTTGSRSGLILEDKGGTWTKTKENSGPFPALNSVFFISNPSSKSNNKLIL